MTARARIGAATRRSVSEKGSGWYADPGAAAYSAGVSVAASRTRGSKYARHRC
ncbi:MAG: hypothetical protein K2Y23_00140 [Cyanobacteria bacterium]|nr:hypothetical protein [Cyanobacteriota bacterium]